MEEMGFEQWLAQVPGYVKGEKFWQVLAYQKGLFFMSCCGRIPKPGCAMNAAKPSLVRLSPAPIRFAPTFKKVLGVVSGSNSSISIPFPWGRRVKRKTASTAPDIFTQPKFSMPA